LEPAPIGFAAAFSESFGAVLPALPKRRGRRPRVPLAQVLPALVFHVMNTAGTLAEHFAQIFDDTLADSSLSERRTRLPWEVFTELMRLGLRPLAQLTAHPDAFWRGWRLVALDGTQFSLTNTPQVKASVRKAKCRRGRAAFAKLTTGVLLEVGLHNPLAAAIGRGGQSEWVLALELLAQLPARALLLADRLHGCAAFLAAAWAVCEKVGSHFLIRARTNIKVQVVRRFKDGSRLVRVPVRQKGQPRVIVQWLELREIRVQVQRPGHRVQELRLWTSLLDPRSAPAQELIELYARRWEHELYYRELKRQLRKNEVLQSHTVETGAQEIAAVVLASALLARARVQAAAGAAPVLRVSFVKTLELMRPLWLTLALGGDLLSARQKEQLTERFLVRAGQLVTRRRRRPRSCLRAVRQPVSGWPRLRRNQSWEGPVQFTRL
jgi:Transposase DDE domain